MCLASLYFILISYVLLRDIGTAIIIGIYTHRSNNISFSSLSNLLSNAAISLGNAFISLEISCSLLIIFSLFSFIFEISGHGQERKELKSILFMKSFRCLFIYLVIGFWAQR